MIRTSFSTLGCPDWSFTELIEYGSDAGFDGVEIRLLERETDLLAVPAFQPSRLSERRRELTEGGFRVCGIASSVAFDSPDATERQRQVDVGRANLDLAAELEADVVRVFGDIIRETVGREALVDQVAEGLDRLGEYAEPLGLTVVIETHGDFADSRLTRDTLQRVNSDAVGVLWDTHHPWRFCGESLPETFENFGRWVRHTHWKDSISMPRHEVDAAGTAATDEADALMGGHETADYVLFGGGEFPVIECLGLLAGSGYEGWYSLEWEKMWHPDLEGPEVALPLFSPKLRELHGLVSGG